MRLVGTGRRWNERRETRRAIAKRGGTAIARALLALATLLLVLWSHPATARPPESRSGLDVSRLDVSRLDVSGLDVSRLDFSGQIKARLASSTDGVVPRLPLGKTDAEDPAATNPIAVGQQFYAAGQFDRAAAVWDEAAETFRQRGDRLREALSLAYLSLAWQDLGDWDGARAASDRSLDLVAAADGRASAVRVRAIALNSGGRLAYLAGDPETALLRWQGAETAYRQAERPSSALGARLNQIQALQGLGRYRRSRAVLEALLAEMEDVPASALKADALRNLGVVLQVMGEFRRSQAVLEEGLAIAAGLEPSREVRELRRALNFALGNTLRDRDDLDGAIARYQRAIAPSELPDLLAVEATLNQIRARIFQEDLATVQQQLPDLERAIAGLPNSRPSLYARINFASLLTMPGLSEGNRDRALTQLATAVRDARTLRDRRAESYALGQLGGFYEDRQQWPDAQELTRQALTRAEQVNGRDLTVLWQWQLARILTQLGRKDAAIALYRDTVDLLDDLQVDLVAIDPQVQFSYRDRIEPVYRGLVNLLLETVDRSENALERIGEVRLRLNSLRLAELDNFFRENCLEAEAIAIDSLDPQAAVFYTVLLPDRLTTIVSVAGEPPLLYETRQSQEQIEAQLDRYLQSLNPGFGRELRLEQSSQLYDWLVRPAKSLLLRKQIETLVFVPDGMLRNVPLAALYDRQTDEYLIEQYSLALTQSLQLADAGSLAEGEFRAAIGGLSQARQGFSAIPAVESEVEAIGELLSTEVLLDPEFTREAIVRRTRNANVNVIHLATHGQFSSDADETFLLTWDDRINVRDLDRVLRSTTAGDPIDLLVLSACQTAAGDDRATLGLAGFALRSGARSTLATLWSVQDEPTAQLMVEFYRQLRQRSGREKAESLRQAQLSLLRSRDYQHPAYWSPFVLIGNWI